VNRRGFIGTLAAAAGAALAGVGIGRDPVPSPPADVDWLRSIPECPWKGRQVIIPLISPRTGPAFGALLPPDIVEVRATPRLSGGQWKLEYRGKLFDNAEDVTRYAARRLRRQLPV